MPKARLSILADHPHRIIESQFIRKHKAPNPTRLRLGQTGFDPRLEMFKLTQGMISRELELDEPKSRISLRLQKARLSTLSITSERTALMQYRQRSQDIGLVYAFRKEELQKNDHDQRFS